MSDFAGNEIEKRSGGYGLGSGQVPHLSDRPGISTEGSQADGDIGNVAVCVGQVGVAEKVGALAGYGVGKDPLAQSCLGDAGAEEVRCPPDGDLDTTGIGGSQQFLGHSRSGTPLDGRRGKREVFGHRRAMSRAVGVQVLQSHQNRVVTFGGTQHASL